MSGEGEEDKDEREEEQQADGESPAKDNINKARRILYALDFILRRIVR